MLRIVSLDKTRSNRAFSTFKILPRSGKIAWIRRSLPILALPPAESPSTMKISHSLASLDEQSASFPGNDVISIPVFLLVISRAFFAAKRAWEATIAFSTMILAVSGFSNKNWSNDLEIIFEAIFLTSAFPNFVFVCPSYWGSGCLTEIIAVKPSRQSSPDKASSFSFKKFPFLA